MTEFDSIVLKLRILEASIEIGELYDVVRSPHTKARLHKVQDTLDAALGVLRKYTPDTLPSNQDWQGTLSLQRPGA